MTASPARRQCGAALLALVALIMIGGVWFLLYAIQPVNRIVLERDHNAKILREAKQAILGWVVKNAADPSDWNPGKLPCPEALGNFTVPPAAGEGVMQGFCAGAPTAVGRIPWKSLGIDKPYDVTGEVLWYVVSPGWKVPNGTAPEAPLGLNSNSLGGLTVDGVPNAAVAAIIAPGRRLVTAPIASQTAQGCAAQSQFRTTFPPPDSTGYLECQNVAGATMRTGVVDNGTNEAFNDQVILITAADVMTAIEGVIAKRIENTVVPQLQSVYASTQWNSNTPAATIPTFPFAVSFASQTVTQYKGVAGTTQGLLPVVASTSNTVTTGRNDATFVQWDTTSISVVKRSGTANITSANCGASTGNQVSCTISYARTCGGLGCVLGCACPATLEASVLANGQNVGNSLRTFTSAPISSVPAGSFTLVSSDTPLAATGAANADIRGNFPSDTCTAWIIFGFLFPCTSGDTVTVNVPITVFPEHSFVNPTTADAWYWYLANNWHQVTYYAVSQDHVPGGARGCASPGFANCLNVNFEVGTSLTNKQAILVLAGRSVTGTTSANRIIADFLDTTENTNFNSTFEQKRFSKTFNDRFVNVSP
ncbi:MAG TPA: hypothetical protein VM140_00220, partial [Burkholderiales bacterium]|nr:hypothetical protein [Burkholderiales bacterium]